MKFFIAASLLVAASPAFATAPTGVPEMDVGAGVLALAFVIGAGAILREKFFRK